MSTELMSPLRVQLGRYEWQSSLNRVLIYRSDPYLPLVAQNLKRNVIPVPA